MAEYQKPLPRISERTREFWEGCKKRELRIQKCADCGQYRFPPLLMCPKCNSINTEWNKVSGRGEIYSYIIPCRAAPGELPARGFDYPYAVVLVELPDAGGVRIASNIVDCDLNDIKIGMPVEVIFDDVTAEITLPKFKPSS
jgi:uncharacterized OB-fold protein